MGVRFFFQDDLGQDIANGWVSPFIKTPIPRKDEIVTIKCFDRKIRTGIVTSIHYGFDIQEIRIILKEI